MSEHTKYGPPPISIAGPDRFKDAFEGTRIKETLALDPVRGPSRIERHGSTWQAVKAHIKEAQAEHIASLRNKKLDHSETQYARGAMDALDRLLEFAGEDI